MKPKLHRIVMPLFTALYLSGFLQAATVPAVWTNSSSGTLDGLAFNAGAFAFEQISNSDLSGSDFSYAPLASNQSVITFVAGGYYSFASPVEGVLVYITGWNGGPLNGTPATYTFSSAFQVMSGFNNAAVQGNTISVPDGQYASGILRLRGQLSNFSFANSEWDGSRVMMTIAKSTIRFDADADGIEDEFETGTGVFVSPENTGTSPSNPDSDGDGLRDGQEVLTHHTNPNLSDTDGDGYSDPYELLTGHSPTDINDKPSLVAQASPAVELTFSSATGKTYRIEASSDLVAWIAIESGIAGTGSEIQRFYSTKNTSKRFYRVEETMP